MIGKFVLGVMRVISDIIASKYSMLLLAAINKRR